MAALPPIPFENKSEMDALFVSYDNMFREQSYSLWHAARDGYKKFGRGYLLLQFPSVKAALESVDEPLGYVSKDHIKLVEDGSINYVEAYDPEEEFVAAISMVITPSVNIYRCYRISKGSEFNTKGHALLAKMKNHVGCLKCGKTDQKLKFCTACKVTRYCSVQCQTADWSVHKPNCNLMKSINKDRIVFMDPFG